MGVSNGEAFFGGSMNIEVDYFVIEGERAFHSEWVSNSYKLRKRGDGFGKVRIYYRNRPKRKIDCIADQLWAEINGLA